MTIRLNPRWLLISALFFSLQLCRAQVQVPPTLSFDLGSSNAPGTRLWDVGGSYNLNLLVDQRSGIEVPVQLSFTLVQDASGKLSTVSNDFQSLVISDNSLFAITPQISGKVTGSGGFARVHFAIHFSGSGNLAAHNDVPVEGSLTVDAETDPSTNQLTSVKCKFSASFSGFSSLKGPTQFATDLPPGIDGSWNLTLQLVALGKVNGTGTINTPSRSLGLGLSGAFKGGTFKIKARGANDVQDAQDGTGCTATILLSPPFDSLVLNGKFLGQKLSISTQPPE
jgi:hypothetical protein